MTCTPEAFPLPAGGFSIGNVAIETPTVLAPLAGITNLPFRQVVKDLGCGLVCSEMVSANGLIYDSGKTRSMLVSSPKERPLSLQIFGSDPDILADGAEIVEASGADIIDINFGCSVRKVLKSGSGSALMRDPERTRKILSAVRKRIQVPLTIKIRTGWDQTGDHAVTIAKIAQDCGVDAIACHPRTATQGFGGTANWSLIRRLKSILSIPVIGNGDIQTPEDAIRMFRETGCDAVMVGRATLHTPHIFADIHSLLNGRNPEGLVLDRHFTLMERYLTESVTLFGELNACRMMRSRLGWFVKGLPHSTRFRETIKEIETHAHALALIAEFRASVIAHLEDRGRL